MSPAKTAILLAAILVAPSARGSEPSPRLVSPPSGAIVVPGRIARIEIAGAPSGADEWEAFVSVDGGRTYPLRATPHLPIRERAFDWNVPSLPPGPVRVKLRFGSRGVEREFLLDGPLSLGAGDSGSLVVPEAETVGATPAPGEEGTVAWVDRENGRARLIVPASPRALLADTRWKARSGIPVPAPKRNVGAPAAGRSAVRLVLFRPASRPPRPRSRTIASLSRLNV